MSYIDSNGLLRFARGLKNIFSLKNHNHTKNDVGIFIQTTEPTNPKDGDIWIDFDLNEV